MANIEDLFKTVANTFIEDFSSLLKATTSPARIAFNEVQSACLRLEVSSQERLQMNLNRARVFDKFTQYKKHYSSSPDRNGKFVYYFLCSIESLPPPQNEQWIFKATAMIDADPELACKQIGELMHNLTQNGTLNLTSQATLALGG